MIRYATIAENDLVDGDGWSVSLWFQGCPHHCQGCHNPELWDFNGGVLDSVFTVIQKLEKAVYANGISRNLSILGGEPLCKENVLATETIALYFKLNHPEIKIYIWTGYTYEDLLKNKDLYEIVLNNADILIDGPYIERWRDVSLHLRGSSNQRVIDLNKTREKGEIVLCC